VGAREPAYGPLNTVLAGVGSSGRQYPGRQRRCDDQFAIVNLTRQTSDRFRDVDNELRERVLDWLAARGAGQHAVMLVREGGQLDADEQSRVFGEALPRGLRVK
jgi:hypothetical protein